MIHKVLSLPIPLPFGALTAQRSVLSVENFSSAVVLILVEPRARGELFIVAVPTPLTVPELILRRRATLVRTPWLVAVPEKWVQIFFAAAGWTGLWQRIGKPLVARPIKLLALGWKPTSFSG